MRAAQLASLYGAVAVHAAALPSSSSSTISACNAQMNGALPDVLPAGFKYSGNVRRYYVSAEIDTWDYAPTGLTPYYVVI